MSNVTVVVNDNNDVNIITDRWMPENWIVIPTEKGWHVIRGDDYVFMSLQKIQSVWNKNIEEWWDNYLSK